jgi:hypothetical protein
MCFKHDNEHLDSVNCGISWPSEQLLASEESAHGVNLLKYNSVVVEKSSRLCYTCGNTSSTEHSTVSGHLYFVTKCINSQNGRAMLHRQLESSISL